MEWKLFSKCPRCRKLRFIVAKQMVKLPGGLEVKSKELLCTNCVTLINKAMQYGTKN